MANGRAINSERLKTHIWKVNARRPCSIRIPSTLPFHTFGKAKCWKKHAHRTHTHTSGDSRHGFKWKKQFRRIASEDNNKKLCFEAKEDTQKRLAKSEANERASRRESNHSCKCKRLKWFWKMGRSTHALLIPLRGIRDEPASNTVARFVWFQFHEGFSSYELCIGGIWAQLGPHTTVKNCHQFDDGRSLRSNRYLHMLNFKWTTNSAKRTEFQTERKKIGSFAIGVCLSVKKCHRNQRTNTI